MIRQIQIFCLTLLLYVCMSAGLSAQLFRYEEGNTSVTAFGANYGMLQTSNGGRIRHGERGKRLSWVGGPVFGEPPMVFTTRPKPYGSLNSDGERWFITVKGDTIKVYSPGFRETNWIKGTGPVSLGWRRADFLGRAVHPESIDVLAPKSNPWPQSKLVFERSGFDSATGKEQFSAFIERGEALVNPKPSYVTEQLLSASNELRFVKKLYSRHAAELAAILKLRNELKKVPQIGTTTLIGLAGMTSYTEASLRSTFNLLYNTRWDDKTRISPPDLTRKIQRILYNR